MDLHQERWSLLVLFTAALLAVAGGLYACRHRVYAACNGLAKGCKLIHLRLEHYCGCRHRSAVPLYWENGYKGASPGKDHWDPDAFDDVYPVSMDGRAVIQELMTKTAAESAHGFHLVRAVRVESAAMWTAYQARAEKVADRRGKCHFVGRGPPSTMEALADIDSRDCFAEDLDSDICEAYLWHATRPSTALKIAQSGFQVSHHSSVGTRFGTGGYFTEDPTKADTYAGGGEGLYKDCYAMLLCRVILGRQYHTTEFRMEEATSKARSKHDSTLAEPRGSSIREFVVFRSDQVYPEYAIVYERSRRRSGSASSDGEFHGAFTRTLSDGVQQTSLPAYWFHAADFTGHFHETCPDEDILPVIQEMMDGTWKDHVERPEEELGKPEGLRALKVMRFESSKRWKAYVRTMDAVRSHRETCTPFSTRTSRSLPWLERWRLNADINEAYLWQGLSPQAAMSAIEGGYPIRHSSAALGDGIYFSDVSAVADALGEDDGGGYYRGCYAMLLCRVALGEVADVTGDSAPEAHDHVGVGLEFDSAVANGDGCGVANRQVFVREGEQAYPEYLILYERKYASLDHRVTSSDSDSYDAGANSSDGADVEKARTLLRHPGAKG